MENADVTWYMWSFGELTLKLAMLSVISHHSQQSLARRTGLGAQQLTIQGSEILLPGMTAYVTLLGMARTVGIAFVGQDELADMMKRTAS